MSPRQWDRRRNTPDPQCMVRNCPTQADETWTAHSGFADWVVHWDVCSLHGERLDAKEAWAPDYGEAPSWQRTILMGHDLGQRRQISRPDSALARSEQLTEGLPAA